MSSLRHLGMERPLRYRARIDGKSVPILWQVLEEERIYRNDALLKAVIQEEITRHLAKPDGRTPLYLVTDVIKVQEIIPEYYDTGMLHPPKEPFLPAYEPLFENPFMPRAPIPHDKPFVWKYKLECINNLEDVESVSAEHYLSI
ncbi:hypothetical protein F5Y13DRAFT_203989 [Hypoxylon sp. FL1857]|nr:hypothetical protein F5Y13DRAFT_203989 [Hypoxylon sp. FL1857]